MRLFLKIISCVLVLSIVFSFCVLPFTVYADAADTWSTIGSIYDYYVNYDGETFFDQFSDGDFNSCSGCPYSSSGYHEWYFAETGAPISPGTGYYYCAKCGLAYSDYCATAYNDYVSDNYDLRLYDSSGYMIWAPTWEDIYLEDTNFTRCVLWITNLYSDGDSAGNYGAGITVSQNGSSYYLYDLDDYLVSSSSHRVLFNTTSSNSIVGMYWRNGYTSYGVEVRMQWGLIWPITGVYTCTEPAFISTFADPYNYNFVNYSGTIGESFSFDKYYMSYSGAEGTDSCLIEFRLPVFKVKPLSVDTSTNYLYVNASRPTYNITYNLATVTQAGDYTVINNVYEDQTIINEGDNIFIDPDSGDQYDIDTWEYDYTTRTYYCTLADGSLLEVTLGDAYVTVNLNGELEYYYYATPSDGDEVTGGDTECTHDFALAEALEPTCTTGGYEVYVCKLCAATYKDTSFAIGHNYELVETVDPTVTLDESTLVCPGCNATEDLSYELTGDETFTVTCGSCSEEWTVAGSVESGYDLYRCSNCGDEYKDYTGEGVIRDDAGYWSWLQTWLQNFKTWLGEKLDALASGSGSGSGTGDLDVEVDMGDDVDYNITYTDEETGEETNITIKDFIGKFAFIKDIWKIGQTLISVVSEDAAYAYEFDPTIGNEATTDTGTEAVTVSVGEEADTLLSSGSGAPSIPLDLGAAQSVYGFNYGGEVEMLDLSWYTPYKETVDKLVGGFLWLFFMWKLFQRAPDIISGAGMDSYKQEDLSAGNKLSRRRVKTNWRSRP